MTPASARWRASSRVGAQWAIVKTAVWLLTKSPIGVAVLIRSRYLAIREATSSNASARVNESNPRPRAPASSCESGLVHDIHSGGIRDLRELGDLRPGDPVLD